MKVTNSTVGYVRVVAHNEHGYETWIGIKLTTQGRFQSDAEEWIEANSESYDMLKLKEVFFIPMTGHEVVAIQYTRECDAYTLRVDDLPYASTILGGVDRYVDASVIPAWRAEDDPNIIQTIPASKLEEWLKIWHDHS